MGEIRDMWKRMSAGDPAAFMGLPEKTGHGTGDGGPPESLTKDQQDKLMQFFHQQYKRYPLSEYEFQQWLKHNW